MQLPRTRGDAEQDARAGVPPRCCRPRRARVSRDNGFGFGQACDIEKPLNRTYNAIAVFHYSAPNPPTEADDFSGNFLRWGGNYAMDTIDELDCRCGSGSKSLASGETARTRNAGLFQDAWTRLWSCPCQTGHDQLMAWS